MKKTINSFISIFLITLILFSSACKKSSDIPTVTNSAVIKLNGAQPNIDSVTSQVGASNGVINHINIWVYIHSPSMSSCWISLKISPSDPLYAAGSIINMASSIVASITYQGPNAVYADPYKNPEPPFNLLGGSGSITITKNDFSNRRIEGTLTNCVVTNPTNTNDKVTLDGSFAVTYPAP